MEFDHMFQPQIFVFIFLIIASVALFSFLSIASFVRGRQRERDAYYRNETVRRLSEHQGAGADAAIALMREEDRIVLRRRIESAKLSGVITLAIGLGVAIFLGIAVDGNHALGASIGGIPLLVGAALLVYSYRLAPKLQA